jgi:uncharacterized protein
MAATEKRKLIPRHLGPVVFEALSDTPVVTVNGARQVGESTLVNELLGNRNEVVTLDNATERSAAERDPHAFVDERTRPLAIDEKQRAPGLLLAVKANVDRDRRPGRFVLAGSTRLLSTPQLSESVAGRIEVLDLWPLSQGEIGRYRERFVDPCLDGTRDGDGECPQATRLLRDRVLGRVPRRFRAERAAARCLVRQLRHDRGPARGS